MKVISQKLSKRLAPYLKDVDTQAQYRKYFLFDAFGDRGYPEYPENPKTENPKDYGYYLHSCRFQPQFGDFKTLTLEEALDFLPELIGFETGDGYLVITKQEGKYQIGYDVLKPVGYGDVGHHVRKKTLLEAVEAMLEYLLDNDLLKK